MESISLSRKMKGPSRVENGKDRAMAPYSRLVTSRCYVSTFRKIISEDVESSLRNLNIHQFLIFSPFQQNIHLLYELLKCWDCFNEGFLIKGHLLKFTADEEGAPFCLLTC
ncbi:hypothetical protein M5K25_018788 [Dendrobium thyrsiflorum]|uniref:Uncharacterized protein n=1 Tax=Dendrobium thyrsiflorum TaxID=117978 RepID=A0ABD0UK07_DENTH